MSTLGEVESKEHCLKKHLLGGINLVPKLGIRSDIGIEDMFEVSISQEVLSSLLFDNKSVVKNT